VTDVPPASEAQAAAPPGWYPDPSGGPWQRYWTGAAWTEHTIPPQEPAASSGDPKRWAVAAHLSALAGLVIGFNFVGPMIVYLIKKDEDAFVRHHAAEALNFNLSVFLYAVVGTVLTFVLLFVLVGVLLIPVLIALGIAWIVLLIVAAVKASNGEDYRYPLTIRFVS
jgi:uncharacterized Tic20 family protein